MDLLGVNSTYELAVGRQEASRRAGEQDRFEQTLRQAAAAKETHQLERTIDEVVSVVFIAPLLFESMGKGEQTYFLNSRAEQSYARQMYLEIASKLGASGRLPAGRDIAEALQARLRTG